MIGPFHQNTFSVSVNGLKLSNEKFYSSDAKIKFNDIDPRTKMLFLASFSFAKHTFIQKQKIDIFAKVKNFPLASSSMASRFAGINHNFLNQNHLQINFLLSWFAFISIQISTSLALNLKNGSVVESQLLSKMSFQHIYLPKIKKKEI